MDAWMHGCGAGPSTVGLLPPPCKVACISSIRLQVYKVLATIDAHQVTNFFARNFFQDEEGLICGGLLKDLVESFNLADTLEVFSRESGGLSKLPDREELQSKLGIKVSAGEPLLFGMFPAGRAARGPKLDASLSDPDEARKMLEMDPNAYLESGQGSEIMRELGSSESGDEEQLDFNQLLRIPIRGNPDNMSPFSDEDDSPRFDKQRSF